MRRPDRSSRILLEGALVSAAVHVALMLGFVRWSEMLSRVGFAEKQPAAAAEQPKPPAAARPPPTVVRLGLEKSQAATLTWVGFEEATEHQADQSVTEQSAFTTAPPSPAAAPAPRPAPPPPAVLATPTPRPEGEPSPAEAQRRLAEQIRSLSGQLAEAQRALERRLTGLAEAVATAPPTAAPTAARETQPAPQQPQTTTADPQTGLPGSESDKESIATSVKKAVTVRPGQVVAGQGLEIKTRVPRWTNTTILTHRPRNPTVRIVFGRDGAVRQAEFVRDGTIIYNTGSDDVDQPLLNAIYGWTAKGQALRDLKPEDAGVSILITIILSG